MKKVFALMVICLVGFSGLVLAWNQPSKDTTFVNVGNIRQEKIANPMIGWSNPYYGEKFATIFKDAKSTILQPSTKITSGYGGSDCTEIQGDGTMSGTCSFRMVVAPGDCTGEGREASVDVPIRNTKGKIQRTISIRHLDGYADDSFNVYLEYGKNHQGDVNRWKIGTYKDSSSTETWVTNSWTIPTSCEGYGNICGLYKYLEQHNAPKATIVIEATGDLWGECGTYGQLAISSIALD
ncbi:MAG: hypothetical protein PHG05_03660 [Candidatus Nanoarchaeia archaeon]|nr:hypothetical protein [Candidatus Nanoarchaeia archaeon]